MIFNNNNTGNNMFNNNNNNNNNNMFNNSSNPGGNNNNMFNNQNRGGMVFGNNASTPNNNVFNNNNNNNNNASPGNNMFNNNTPNNNLFNNPSNNNMFNNNTGGPNNFFNNNNNNNNNNNMFNNNTPNNMFNMGNNNMGNNTMGNNLFNNTNNNMFNRGTVTGAVNNQVINEYLAFQTSLENTKIQLQDCLRRMSTRNLETIRLDSWNVFKDKPFNKLPFKEETVKIMFNFNELKKTTDELKKSNQQIENKMASMSKQTHKKLALYKKCLLKTVSHTKLIEEVSSELQVMNKEMQEHFQPLYNAYKHKKKLLVKQPNEFDLKISYDVLNKLEILNQRVDDMIACQNSPSEDQVQSTITVFEQLIQYYQNVSCSFKQFTSQYNKLKKQAIERERRGNYEAVISKVIDKAEENLKKQFKYYDLIKEIDDILADKERRQEKKRLQAQNRFDTLNTRKTYF